MDWTNSKVSQSAEEREAEMFGLVIGFVIQIRKQATNAKEGTTPGLEVPSDKGSRPSIFDEGVQAAPMVIVVDSPE